MQTNLMNPSDPYRFSLGDFHYIILQDEDSQGKVDDYFSTLPVDVTTSIRKRYGETLTLSFNCLLVMAHGKRILVDTGNGVDTGGDGRLLNHLASLDIAPESIDIVVLSHAHADHYAAMLDKQGNKVFPNAQYLMWRDEWRHYSSEQTLEQDKAISQERFDFKQSYFLPLKDHLRFLHTDSADILPDIQAVYLPGHTQHHIGVQLHSQGQTLFYLADLFVHPSLLPHPEVKQAFDVDAASLLRSRQWLMNELADKDVLVLGYHFPFPGLGYICKQQDGFVWQPL